MRGVGARLCSCAPQLVTAEIWINAQLVPGNNHSSDRPLTATSGHGLFYKVTGQRFLIGTSVQVSILPATRADRTVAPILYLQAVNGTRIPVFQQRSLTLSLRLRRMFGWLFTPTEAHYSSFGLELPGIYLTIRHFCHIFKRRPFSITTDHKLLTYALYQESSTHMPREICNLLFISELSTDIRHVNSDQNVPADTLSRVNTVTPPACPAPLNAQTLAVHQVNEPELLQLC